jgi:hypothetical protein
MSGGRYIGDMLLANKFISPLDVLIHGDDVLRW